MTAGHAARTYFLLRHLGPALLAAALLFAMETTAIDAAISGWFFDPATASFPLRYNALFELITHQWAKYVVVLIACAVIAAWLMSFVLPALIGYRRVLLFLSLALTLAPATVSTLKAVSPRSCPYDLVEYGGHAPRLGLLEAAPPGESPGHCFPSGHASAGFCLFAFYFAGRALGSRRLMRAGLWGGLAAGTFFGLARVAQGAHFLSHNLWSALVCWLVILALYVATIGLPQGATAVPAPGPRFAPD